MDTCMEYFLCTTLKYIRTTVRRAFLAREHYQRHPFPKCIAWDGTGRRYRHPQANCVISKTAGIRSLCILFVQRVVVIIVPGATL